MIIIAAKVAKVPEEKGLLAGLISRLGQTARGCQGCIFLLDGFSEEEGWPYRL